MVRLCLRLQTIAYLLLEALRGRHTEVICRRVDRALRTQTTIRRILRSGRCEARIDRALGDPTDRLVLRVIDLLDLLVTPLESARRVEICRMVGAIFHVCAWLWLRLGVSHDHSACRQLYHRSTAFKVMLAGATGSTSPTLGHIVVLVVVDEQVLVGLQKVLRRVCIHVVKVMVGWGLKDVLRLLSCVLGTEWMSKL